MPRVEGAARSLYQTVIPLLLIRGLVVVVRPPMEATHELVVPVVRASSLPVTWAARPVQVVRSLLVPVQPQATRCIPLQPLVTAP